jgi:transcriptional regulator with XRE-family HTH domain
MASIPSQAIPDLQRLGERLRQAREQQGISREELAERLHLGTEQLTALETADSGRLHEPVFVIAQARRLAAALNLGIEPEISALRRCGMGGGGMASGGAASTSAAPTAAAASSAAPATPAAPTRPAPASPARRGWLPWLAAPAAVLVAVLGLLMLRRPPAPTVPAPAPSAAAPSAAALPAASAAAGQGSGSGSGAITGTTNIGAQGASQQYSLRALSSQDSSWVEVRNNGGQVLFRGRLEGEKSFPLGAGLQVLAGRPDLVAAGLAGVPLQPLGKIDQVNWKRIAPTAPPR